MIREYLTFDAYGVLSVGCMKCGVIVATRRNLNGLPLLVHQSHSKRHRVTLSDNTYAEVIVCQDCVGQVTPGDYQDFEDTMKWGWQREIEWKFNESARGEDRRSYEQFAKANGISKAEAKLPKRVFDKLFERKAVMNKKERKK